MSASLVGSEMCIRDSRATSPVTTISQSCPRSMTRGAGSARVSSRRVRGCLLYTSDAADDM
eukprot:1008242-Alexandrium_andersonii.AAC.1